MAAPLPELPPGSRRDIYTISRLNREVRLTLETSFPLLWVEGEISNLSRPGSGHLYFSLKDDTAQVRCAMFRMRNLCLRFTPESGMQVLVRARVGLYEGRGEFQLIVEHMEPAGEGALQRAFEQLKQRLAQEGLFAREKKKPVPEFPARVGVITSPTGAAIHDVLTTLERRFPALSVVIYPVPVQGDEAAAQIASALRLANSRAECDVLILARGGGSLEDLRAFNDEGVARALFDSRIPVVSGIGHEIDFTIADFVADHRAATPSAAAEMVTPNREDLITRLSELRDRLINSTLLTLQQRESSRGHLGRRLLGLHPQRQLNQRLQRLDELDQRLLWAVRSRLRSLDTVCAARTHTLFAHAPRQRVAQGRLRLQTLRQGLERSVTDHLTRQRQRLALGARSLQTVSPLATLDRGYAIVSKLPERTVVRRPADVRTGDLVEARLADGFILCRVEPSGD